VTAATGPYALLEAAAQAVERHEWRNAVRLSAVLLQRWEDLLEAHHLRGVATYYATIAAGGSIAVPADHLRLTSTAGALHQRFAAELERAGFRDLARQAYGTAARLDFHLLPGLRAGFAGPFNGQVLRTAAFRAIARHRPAEVVETGAHRGTTSEFMAQAVECPVRTTELHPYYFEFARLRFEEARRLGAPWARSLRLDAADSVTFLTGLLAEAPARDGLSFYYLDAHGDYLGGEPPPDPMNEELRLIRGARRHCIVMVDDFAVADDPGYVVEEVKSLADIAPSLPSFDAYFYPIAARHDTGMLRGCIVLSGSPEATALLAGIDELRMVAPR
jgi:hypothetical protein